MVERESDSRLHCPYCTWSTQLPNKFERHLQKKHRDEIVALSGPEMTNDEEE